MDQAKDQRDGLLDVPAAAKRLGTTERHVRRLVEERRIPFVKLGSVKRARLRFVPGQLDEWIEEHSVKPGEWS